MIPIDDLDLPKPLAFRLKSCGAKTISDVANLGQVRLQRIQGIGAGSVALIAKALAAHGLSLRQPSWAVKHPPAPEGFRERFIDPTPRGGWRGCERAYGARREVMQRWIAECGGPKQLAEARKRAMIRLKDEIRQAKAIQSMRIRATLSRGRTMGMVPE